MALLLALAAICGGFILLTAIYPLFCLAALACLGALLACSLRLFRQSRTDSLTALYNLYHLNSRKKQYKRVSDLWVFYLDLDHLKQVNDTEGHTAGDLLLRDSALFLRTACGKDADIYRVGGDEFLLFFPSRPSEFFLSLRWPNEKVPGSCGFAHGPGLEFDSLVARAEQAMYASRGQNVPVK